MPLADTPPAPRTPPGNRCGVSKLNLTDDDLATLNGWLGDYGDQAIADRLTEEGHPISHQILARHRLHRCSCYR